MSSSEEATDKIELIPSKHQLNESKNDTINEDNDEVQMSMNKTMHKVHSSKLNFDFTVYVQDETNIAYSKCYIMTVHDIGCDHGTFLEFISTPEMRSLKERIVWLHVDLPGQENNASDLNIEKYPSLIDIGSELVEVLNYFKIPQATFFGEGAGANICCRFAIQHPSRCMGVILINPSGSTASFIETMTDKINNWRLMKQGMNARAEAYLVWHHFGQSAADSQLVQANIKDFHKKLYENRNPKNLALFIDSFLNRTNILEKLDNLKVDVLVAVGRKASNSSETKKFYKALVDSRRSDLNQLVNCPLLEVEEIGDIMGEAPDRLATSIQFFLQGIGLLPALPMKKTLQGLGRLSRAMSMEDADKPRRTSYTEPSQLAAN